MENNWAPVSMAVAAAIMTSGGCQQDPEAVALGLQLRSALTQSQIDYVEVKATQGDTTIRATPDRDGNVSLRITAGVEARLEATIFSIDQLTGVARWRSFEGRHIFVPQPGANEIDMEPRATALRDGSVTPTFGDGTPWEVALPIRLIDPDTGFENVEDFTTGSPFELPLDRSMYIFVERPDTGEIFTATLFADTDLAEGFPLEIGASPVLPELADLFVDGPTLPIEPGDAVFDDPTFPVECAIGTDCSDPELEWVDCADLNLAPVAAEKAFGVLLRFVEVPGLGCSEFEIIRDKTAPLVSIELDPGLVIANTPTDVTATLVSNEELSAPLLQSAAGELCSVSINPFVRQPSLGDGKIRYACTFSADWAEGLVTLDAEGTDNAGNPFTQSTAIVTQPSAQPTLIVVGARTDPIAPSNGPSRFLLGIDVVNLTAEWACDVSVNLLSFERGGTPESNLMGYSWGYPHLKRLAGSTVAEPIVGTLWVEVEVLDEVTAGAYDVALELSHSGDTDPTCEMATGPQVVIPDVKPQINLMPAPIKWLGSASLGIPVRTWTGAGTQGLSPAPLVGGAEPGRREYTYEVSDQVVAPISPQETDIEGTAPGSAVVTATDSKGASAVIEIEVSPSPDLLALQSTRVSRISRSGDESFTVEQEVGSPVDVLWESTRDFIVVVGTDGVQRIPPFSSGVETNPCGAVDIIDAAITAGAPAHNHAQPDVALLVEGPIGTYQHCELTLDDEPSSTRFALDSFSTCTTPTHLVADPITGTFTVVGAGCGFSYVTSSGTVSGLGGWTDATYPHEPIAVAYDPFAQYMTVVTEGIDSVYEVYGARVGSAFQRSQESYDIFTFGGDGASAAVVDPVTGMPIVATWSDVSAIYESHLYGYLDRYGTPVREPGITEGSVNFNSGWHVPLTRLALDPANRLIYAAFNKTTPAIRVATADYLGSIADDYVLDLPTTEPVAALAIAGPLPVGLEPLGAPPGGLVTIHGTGFAGEGNDVVYVHGVRATVVKSTPTSVLFEVPHDFEIFSEINARVNVLTHGRMSGPVPRGLDILPRRSSHKLGSGASWFFGACNRMPCEAAPLVTTPDGAYASRIGGFNEGIQRFATGAGGLAFWTGVEALTKIAGGRRMVGHRDGNWHDMRVPYDPWTPVYERTSLVFPLTVPAPAVMASSPAGDTLAAASTAGVEMLWASTSLPGPMTLPSSTLTRIDRLVFFPDGSALVAAANSGEVEVYALGDTPTVSAVTIDTASCPAGSYALLGMWPRTAEAAEVVAFLSFTSEMAVATIHEGLGSYVFECRTSTGHGISPPAAAALSPYGDIVAIAENAGSLFGIRLLDAADLDNELDFDRSYVTVLHDLVLGTGVVTGRSPELFILDDDQLEVIAVTAIREEG